MGGTLHPGVFSRARLEQDAGRQGYGALAHEPRLGRRLHADAQLPAADRDALH